MSPLLQHEFEKNRKLYNYLMLNSHYYKELDRGTITIKEFSDAMKEKYKERISDKLESAINSIELVSSVLDAIK